MTRLLLALDDTADVTAEEILTAWKSDPEAMAVGVPAIEAPAGAAFP